ncbi:MAG: hypothetical protein SVY53_13685, partial [Chloroflexota bacterium]|nr:hypothetical protein [Chloroflexota bacterium]
YSRHIPSFVNKTYRDYPCMKIVCRDTFRISLVTLSHTGVSIWRIMVHKDWMGIQREFTQ